MEARPPRQVPQLRPGLRHHHHLPLARPYRDRLQAVPTEGGCHHIMGKGQALPDPTTAHPPPTLYKLPDPPLVICMYIWLLNQLKSKNMTFNEFLL